MIDTPSAVRSPLPVARRHSIPDRDPIALAVSEAFLSFRFRLPDVSPDERAVLNMTANAIVADHLKGLTFGGDYFRLDPLWYRSGADAWATDADFVAAARERLAQDWPVQQLEVLLRFGDRAAHLPRATRLLDRWLAGGGPDYEMYMDLTAELYPDHPPTRRFIRS